MRVSNVRKAQAAANVFLARVKALLAEEAERERANGGERATWITASKLPGAVRRASMDLTRALAEMRRP